MTTEKEDADRKLAEFAAKPSDEVRDELVADLQRQGKSPAEIEQELALVESTLGF